MAEECQPGGAIGILSRPVVMGENSSNHVFVDFDLERQGDLLGDSRTAPVGITLLHFDDSTCAQVRFESVARAELGLDISVAHCCIKVERILMGKVEHSVFNQCQQEETGDENGPADSQCPGVG